MTATRAPGTHDLTTRRVKLSTLRPHPRNARNGDVDAVAESLTVNGQYRPIVVTTDGTILAGNHTYAAALSLGWDRISVVTVDVAPESPEALRIMLADNRTADLGGYDDALLLELLRDLDSLDGSGYVEDDVAELELLTATQAGADLDLTGGSSLASRFLIPPFTVLDARQGWWQDRKRAWIALGIKSEEGRDGSPYKADGYTDPVSPAMVGVVKPSSIHMATTAAKPKPTAEGKRTLGQGLTAHRGLDGTLVYEEMPGTAYVSIFDPVLCELTYRWFCPPGGAVLDPYAGGSVRGIVAGRLGLTYTGVELRPEQVAANVEQARDLLPDTPALPTFDQDAGTTGAASWICGGSSVELPRLPSESADLVFTCPPYYDLETYSDDPRDLSAMSTEEFDAAYAAHLAECARILRPDRFAVMVVGNVRDKQGTLRDLGGVTTRAMEAAGLRLCNDAILVTAVGSASMRAARQFVASRSLGRTHQQVLVYVKGSRKAAADACGVVDTSDALAGVEVTDADL